MCKPDRLWGLLWGQTTPAEGEAKRKMEAKQNYFTCRTCQFSTPEAEEVGGQL
jgi:hypothetical protein